MTTPYRFPTTTTYETVVADLGNVESSTSNHSGLATPDVQVSVPVPAVATLLAQAYTLPGEDVPLTSLPQRSTVVERDYMDVLLGRPQMKPDMRAYSSTYCTHVPITLEGLDTVLGVDLGASWRFVVDHTTTVASPFYPSGGLGAFGWTPAQGTDDLVNVQLEMNANFLPSVFAPIPDLGFAYTSRLGSIVRPAVDIVQLMTTLKRNDSYAGSNPLLSMETQQFTVSIVADIDESDWAWTDIAGTFDSVGKPDQIKDCVLRIQSDRLQVFGHGKRAFDELVTDVAEGPKQTLNLPTRRPSIIVWSMDCNGKGSLAVITPKVIYSGDFTFPSGPQWQLRGYTALTPGSEQANGGFALGFPNFIATGTGDLHTLANYGSAASWGLYDVGLWSRAMPAHEALVVAMKLDSVYGVHQ